MSATTGPCCYCRQPGAPFFGRGCPGYKPVYAHTACVDNLRGPWNIRRVRAGLSQGQAARLIGIDFGQLAAIEGGAEKPGPELEARMTALYSGDDVPPWKLAGRVEAMREGE